MRSVQFLGSGSTDDGLQAVPKCGEKMASVTGLSPSGRGHRKREIRQRDPGG